jgi:hypothetical protein
MTFNIPDDCILVDDGLQAFLAARFGRDCVPDRATNEFNAFCDNCPDDVAIYLNQMRRGGLHTTVFASDGARAPEGSDPLPNVIWNELNFEQLMYVASIAKDASGGLEPFRSGVVCVEKQRYFEWLRRETREHFFSAVAKGEIVPNSADKLLAAAGFEPLYAAPDLDEFHPENEPYWTLAMTVAWMVWHTIEAVTNVWEPFVSKCRYWGESSGPGQLKPGFVLEQSKPRSLNWLRLSEAAEEMSGDDSASMTVKEARETLWRTLQDPSAGLSATAIKCGNRIEIPSIEWQDLELQIQGQSHAERDTLGTRHQCHIYEQATLPRVKVQALWGESTISNAENATVQNNTLCTAIADIIRTKWPNGITPGLKAKDRNNMIVEECTKTGVSNPSIRTVSRAMKLVASHAK